MNSMDFRDWKVEYNMEYMESFIIYFGNFENLGIGDTRFHGSRLLRLS